MSESEIMSKLHKRTLPVQKASNEIRLKIIKLIEKHDLTLTEELGIYLELAQDVRKYLLRYERHGKGDKKADEA